MSMLSQNVRYPDLWDKQTIGSVKSTNSVDQQISASYGNPQFPLTDYQVDARRNKEVQSLFEAQEGQSSIMARILDLQLEEMQGWHVQFARPVRTTVMEIQFRMKSAPRVALKKAPEGVGPTYVGLNTETRSETLRRYNLGAIMSQDFLKTEAGREEAAQKQAIVVSGAIITCKLIVERAIVEEKLYYREYQRQYGNYFSGVRDALENEVRWFGIFNKDEKAIYKLKAEIDQIVRQSGKTVKLSNLVVCPGTLNMLSLGSKYETEVSRRGETSVIATLMMGARYFQGIFDDAVIFENPEWKIDNISQEEIQSFRHTVNIGTYEMIDGSDHSLDTRKLGVLVKNAASDTMSLWKPADAIDQSMRFGDDGELSPALYRFAQNVGSELLRARIGSIKNGLIDPYLWVDTGSQRSDTLDSRALIANPQNVHVIHVWGAMNPEFWTYQQSVEFGERVDAEIRKSRQLTDEDYNNIFREYEQLSDYLSNVPSNANRDNIVNFLNAVRNANLGDAALTGVVTVPANVYGSVNLPTPADLAGLDEGARASVDRPWGYAGINHFRYLASLSGDARYGDFTNVIERADRIVRSVDRYVNALQKIFPDSTILNASQVPEHARSGDEQYDTVSAFVFQALDRARHPIYIRRTGGADDTANGNRAILTSAAGKLQSIAGPSLSNASVEKIINSLRDTVLDWLLDAKTTNESLAETYVSRLSPVVSVESFSAAGSNIQAFVRTFGTVTNSDSNINFLISLVGLLYFAYTTRQKLRTIDNDYLEQMRQVPATAPPASKKRARDQEKATERTGIDGGFVNTRLVFNPTLFTVLGDNATIRPEDPQRGGPLALGARTQAQDFRSYAKAKASGPNPFLGQLLNSGNKVPRTASSDYAQHIRPEDDEGYETQPSGFDSGDKRFVRQQLLNDRSGPAYTSGDKSGSTVRARFLVQRLEYISERARDTARVPAILGIFSRPTKRSLLTWLALGLPYPDSCDFLVRPWVRLITEGLLAFASSGPAGSAIANLYYGFEDVSNQHDNTAKIWQLHYTIYLGCGIMALDHLMFVQDINIVGYEGGLDLSVYTDVNEFDAKSLDFSTAKSGFCFSQGANFSRDRALAEANPLSLTGAHESTSTQHYRFKTDVAQREFQQWWFLYYNFLWSFTDINSEKHYNDYSFQSIRDSDWVSLLCWFSRHHSYDPHTQDYTKVHNGTGHLGNVRAPFLAQLSGKIEYLNDKMNV